MAGYTLEEMQRRFGPPPVAGATTAPKPEPFTLRTEAPKTGFTPEEMAARFGNPDTGTQPVKRSKFFDALDTVEGENKVQDFGVGGAKAIIGTGIHAAQFVSKLLGNKGNNALNANSAQGQYVNESLKGNTGTQKFGKTVGDVGLLFAPGGAVTKAGEAAAVGTKAIPRLAEIAGKTGTAARAARFAPKLARSAVETYAGNAALTGRTGFKDEEGKIDLKNAAAAVAGPFVAPVLKTVGRIPALVTQKGRSKLAQKGAEALEKAYETGDQFQIGEAKQAASDFSDAMRKIFKTQGGAIPNRILSKAESKLTGIENRASETAKKLGEEHIPREEDVFNNIFKNGMIDGIDSETGRYTTAKAQTRQTDQIKENAELLQRQLSNSNSRIDARNLGVAALNDISAEGGEGGAIAARRKIAEKAIKDNPVLLKQEATPAELHQLSKDLREEAFKADAYTAEGNRIDSAKADVFRQLAAKIDDALFGGAVTDIDTAVANQLRDNQALAYSTRSVLQAIERIKGISWFNRFIAEGVGAAIGYSKAGFLGGVIGRVLGRKAVIMADNAYGNKKLSSMVMQQFAETANKKEINRLKQIVEESVERNKYARTKAEKAASDQRFQRKLKEFLEKRIERKTKGRNKFMETGNVGTKYLPEEKLPVIDFGKTPKKKIGSYYKDLPVIE